MSRFVLIHGYGSAVKYSVFKNYNLQNLAFSGFNAELKSGEAELFAWYIPQNWGFFQVFNPLSHLNIYKNEVNKAKSVETSQALHSFLIKHHPKIIVCHSMGPFLLYQYLHRFKLPDSVNLVVFVQADIPQATNFPNLKTPIYNLYCPWDPALLTSFLINLSLPAGLFGLKNAAKNKLLPLWSSPNLHIASIGNKKIMKLINSFEKDL